MSFSVSMDGGQLEYSGTDLSTLFAQRRNLLRPRFLGMVRDILRFNRLAKSLLADPNALAAEETLAMLDNPDERERTILGAFSFQENHAYLHTDRRLMPRRQKV